MVDFYVDRIHRGKITIDSVPASLREKVIETYNKTYPYKPIEE